MPNRAVSAPAGSLSQAIATGTPYGVDVPRMLRTESAAANAPAVEADASRSGTSPPVGPCAPGATRCGLTIAAAWR